MKKNPMGFHPSDKEKIAYLLHKVNGKPLPCEDFISIPTLDVYGDAEPWEVFGESDDTEIYFFSKLKLKEFKKAGTNEISYTRFAGIGAWHICANETGIFDSRGEEIGFMNVYKFRSHHHVHQDQKWLLEEYTLADEFKNCVKGRYNGYRLCSLKKNPDFVSDVQERRTQKVFDKMLAENKRAPSSSSSPGKKKRDRSPGPSVDLKLGLKR